MFIPEWLIWAVVTLFSLALFIAVVVATVTVARRRRARFAEATETAAEPATDFALKDSDFTAGRPGTWTPLEGPAIVEDETGR